MPELTIIKLGIVFLTIIVLLAFKRPLYQAILAGLIVTAVLYGIDPLNCLKQISNVFTNFNSVSVILSLYLITFLQRILEARSQIKYAQQDLNGLFHNRRVNAAGTPLFIGLLPSAAAMILCGDIVKDATDGYLDKKQQAFVTSWIRHIPESSLPTYSGVLLMSSLSGVPLPQFMLGMIIPILVLLTISYIPYLRKLPKDPGTPKSENRWKDALHLIQHLWTLIAILVLILVFQFPVIFAVAVVIIISIPIYRFRWSEIKPMFRSSFEYKMILNTFLVLVLKEFIAFSGVLQELPSILSGLSIPTFLIFALLFFVGGIISGSNGIIALGTPIAFATMPAGGMPLMVLLMCMCHAASQVSPTHVCLVVASDYYGISLGALIRKTIPYTMIFCASMIGYYMLLSLFL